MPEAKPIPFTAKQLHEIFVEREPGVLYWKIRSPGRWDISKPAGIIRPRGYCHIKIHGNAYLRHRLIFLMYTGEQHDMLDHIKGVMVGDMFSNLQVSNGSHNQYKKSMLKNNTSGIIGVRWNKAKKKWRATIGVNGKGVHLGTFNNKHEARNAYLEAKNLYHNGERSLI